MTEKQACRPLSWVLLGAIYADHSDKNGRRTRSNTSASPSTYKLFEERGVWLRFAELSDRPISLVCRAPVTAPNQRRTHQFALPGRINSEFTAFRGGKDLCSHPSTRGGSACHKRENFPASKRQAHLHATCAAGRTRRALKLVRRDAAFLIMSLCLPPSPSNLREKQLSEKIWKWARRVLDETPSRVVQVLLLDANGHISQNTWPEQIGKYSR